MRTYSGGLVRQVLFEVNNGAEYEGNSLGEHVVEGYQRQFTERHDDAHNYRTGQ